ncbi:MAG TPA: urease accessory protein [Thermoanaerobaculia bacterium]|jgi:ABC-type nickel/cobalt efflux system permease component RcnA|nr:urease accessory protein [Thermoanaerobaculia bacterium]
MTSLLLLGLLLGMRHALEADHVAAVASLATRSRNVRGTVLQGVAWGFGHTITLLAVGGVCLALRAAIPQRLAAALEGAVGVMLLLLGADVLRRLRRGRIHLHAHRHDDGTVHLHAHRHAPAEVHDPHRHEHTHRAGFPSRALLVGLVHGMAGSAALLMVAVTTLSSVWLGVVYIAVFGAGSILGMAVLAAVISLPLQGTARNLTPWYHGIEALVGVGTILVGGWVLFQTPWVQALLSRMG